MGPYGGVPGVPSPLDTQNTAVSGDIAQFPNYANLAQMYNLANYNTQAQEVAGTPGFASVLSNLQGQVPADVANRIAQTAAERGVSTGTIGSPNANAALLSAMGLTSLDLQSLGQQQYGALLGHFPMAAPFDMQAWMVSPEQQQAAQNAANINAAAPDPTLAAQENLKNLLDAIRAGQGTIPRPGGVTTTTTTPAGGTTTPGGATTTPPPTMVYGGGGGPGTPPPGGGGGVGPGPGAGSGAGVGAGAGGTYPGFGPGGSPSQSQWDSFLAGLNPNQTGANTWLGMQPQDWNFWNSFQTPGFGGGLTPSDWEGFLGALNNPQPPAGSLPGGGGQTTTGGGQTTTPSDWWNQPDPWSSLSNMDWGAPPTDTTGDGGSTGGGEHTWAEFEQAYWDSLLNPDQAQTGLTEQDLQGFLDALNPNVGAGGDMGGVDQYQSDYYDMGIP